MVTTVGQLLVNDLLPQDMRKYNHVLDKNGISALFKEIEEKHPDKYRDIAAKFMKLGHYNAQASGSSLNLSSLLPTPEVGQELEKIKAMVDAIAYSDMPDDKKEKKIVDFVSSKNDSLQKGIYQSALANDNPYAIQVKSGSRGNDNQLKQLIAGDVLVTDHRDRVIPVPILHGYAHGIDPVEYWAASYGARRGSICLHEDTLVYLSNMDTKSIKDIQVGEKILGASADGNTPKSVTVVRKYDNGLQPCNRYTFKCISSGLVSEIVATPTHKILATSNDYHEPTLLPLSEASIDNGYQCIAPHGLRLALVSIDTIGPLPTYDLEVDSEEHTFVLWNWIVSSNSTKFCLSGETEVLCNKSDKKPIKDIKPGDKVWVVDETNKLVPTYVTSFFDNGHRDCYTYVFNNGITITATKEHKVLTKLGTQPPLMRPLEDLTNDSTMCALVFSDNKYSYLPLDGCVYAGFIETYDIEVEHPSHRFVLANGLTVSNSTQEAGAFGKQLVMAVHRLTVTEKDCGTQAGMPTNANDSDNAGAILAQDADGYKAGTLLTPEVLKSLGNSKIVVRSPTTCQAKAGLCSKCSGMREKGRLPEIGDNLGVAAAQTIGERLAQGSLGAKHSGGAISGKQEKDYGGFKNINQLIQVPSTFRDGASIARADGSVQKIEKAPQGGMYIHINNDPHYVHPDMAVHVKTGDKVEAGDVLSEGIVNPAEITEHKGIGEGRIAWIKAMQRSLNDSGIKHHRRNLEVIARGLINHVRVTDMDNHVQALPDEVVSYEHINSTYKPREGASMAEPSRVINKYLEEPVLHYTIGTRITPKIADSLKEYGINNILTHPTAPPFEPEMIQAKLQPIQDENWMTRMGGGYLERGILQATHKGMTSKTHDTSFIPSLAEVKDFGKTLSTDGKY